MLKEEQAAELIRRCEALAGRLLPQLRGNLARASTRAEAVWEMLVVEAASHLGKVECESPEGGPDVRLWMPSGRWVSIEATYLHPRFENEEDRCRLVATWMNECERRLGPPRVAIECRFGNRTTQRSGARLKLPQERRQFLQSAEVVEFLAAVHQRPHERHQVALTSFDITLLSRPRVGDADTLMNWSGYPLDSPKTVDEHAAYRSLLRKIKQHKVDEPYIVCIGSDVSRVLRRSSSLTAVDGQVQLPVALGAAIGRYTRVSAVLVVPIESEMPAFTGWARLARPTLYPVVGCRHPLSQEEIATLTGMNLNRWKYTFPLSRRETEQAHRHPKVSGPLGYGSVRGVMKLTIPASVLVDVLAGRMKLLDQYGGDDGGSFGKSVAYRLREGWAVVGCSFKEGNLEQGQGAMVELEIGPSHDPVYWGRKAP